MLCSASLFLDSPVLVVLRDTVLRQEVVLDERGDVERHLVVLAERALADELHNLGQLLVLLQQCLGRRTQLDEAGLVLAGRDGSAHAADTVTGLPRTRS